MNEECFAEVLELKGKKVITILLLYIMNLTRAFSAHFFSSFVSLFSHGNLKPPCLVTCGKGEPNEKEFLLLENGVTMKLEKTEAHVFACIV